MTAMVGTGSPVAVTVIALNAVLYAVDTSAIAEIDGAIAVKPIVIANVVSDVPAELVALNVTVRSSVLSVGVPEITPPVSVTPFGSVLFCKAM